MSDVKKYDVFVKVIARVTVEADSAKAAEEKIHDGFDIHDAAITAVEVDEIVNADDRIADDNANMAKYCEKG
jgi:hypothetical protein